MRYSTIVLLLLLAATAYGCPKPITLHGARVARLSTPSEGSRQARSGPMREGNPAGDVDGVTGVPTGPAPVEAPSAQPLVGPELKPNGEGNNPGQVGPAQPNGTSDQVGPQQDQAPPQPPVGPLQPEGGATGQPGVVGPQQPAPAYGALDAENFMGNAPRETVWGQPPPRLGKDALAFSGRWAVAVIHRSGEARLLDNAEEWVLLLDTDGQFYAKQVRGEQTWRQNGTWELSGTKLMLHSGPGGEREFDLSQEMPNLCVLRDPTRETALFCVKLTDSQPPPVQATYDTDFGELNLRPSGPGHWRGGYGAPQGTLLVAQLGGYLVGTWEQAPSRGFVVLELREGGFAGAWLYEKNTDFDGRWVGVAQH